MSGPASCSGGYLPEGGPSESGLCCLSAAVGGYRRIPEARVCLLRGLQHSRAIEANSLVEAKSGSKFIRL